MGQAEDLAFFRFCTCIVAGILYFVVFAIDSVQWVETDEITWGLWKWRNTTDQMIGGVLTPAEQPGYYNAVRTLACFVLIGIVLYFFTLDLNKGLGADLKPLWIGLSNMTLLTIMLALVGGFYKDDDRWKHRKPKLGWCYWVALASDCFIIISAAFFWFQYRLKTASVAPQKKGPVKKTTTPAPKKKTEQKPKADTKEKPKTDTKPQPQAKDTKAQNKPTTTTTPPPTPPPKKTEPEPAENQDPKPPSPIVCTKPVLPALIVDGDGASPMESEAAEGEPQDHKPRRPSTSSSISVDFEPYHIPELPGLEPNQAGEPDYEMAAGRADMKTPAVALPQNSVWNKTRKAMRFFANYAKAAVGRRSNDDTSQAEGEA